MEDDQKTDKIDAADLEDIYRVTEGDQDYRVNREEPHPGLRTADSLFQGGSGSTKVFIAEGSYMDLLSSGYLNPEDQLTLYSPAEAGDTAEHSPEFDISNFGGDAYKTDAVEIYFGRSFDDSVPLEHPEAEFSHIEVHVPTWESFLKEIEDVVDESR